MNRTYECMFLIDNDVVRAGWGAAKAGVAGLIEKHGGSTVTSRRWAERRLAYPIRHKNRATYLLTYCELDPARISTLRGDLDISESVLRYLILTAEDVPTEERELSDAENAADFPGFGEGATFTELSGVLNYTFGNFKLAPRSAVELGGYTAPPG